LRIVSSPGRTADSSIVLASLGSISRRYWNFPSCSRKEATFKWPYWSSRIWLKAIAGLGVGQEDGDFPVRGALHLAGRNILLDQGVFDFAGVFIEGTFHRLLGFHFQQEVHSSPQVKPQVDLLRGKKFRPPFGKGSTRVGTRKMMERAKKAAVSPALHWMLLHMFRSPLDLQIGIGNSVRPST
jgi:hypothetical protein